MAHNCDDKNCSSDCAAKNLVQMGINVATFDYVVALAGNPNTGKSTVFNYLTGLKQHTGNWPGKTVTRAEGAFDYNNHKFKIIDLPGTYSLLATSQDEEIARDFILFGQPNVTVVVVDSTRLERNLNLVLQILEITDSVVVCLNLADEAERNNIKVDERALARELGVPVAVCSARDGVGMNNLINLVDEMARKEIATKAKKIIFNSSELKNAIATVSQKLKAQFPNLNNSDWVAARLIEGDNSIINAVKSGRIGELAI